MFVKSNQCDKRPDVRPVFFFFKIEIVHLAHLQHLENCWEYFPNLNVTPKKIKVLEAPRIDKVKTFYYCQAQSPNSKSEVIESKDLFFG